VVVETVVENLEQRSTTRPIPIGSKKGNWIPIQYLDFELTIESSAPKQILIDTLKVKDDLYLMYQTLDYVERFTGKRMNQ
jgi:hypothetical protein